MDPTIAGDNCKKECASLSPPRGGTFNQEFGQCMCDQTPIDCNITCQKNKPKVTVQRNPNTGVAQLFNSEDSTTINLQDETGLNDFDHEKHQCQVRIQSLKFEVAQVEKICTAWLKILRSCTWPGGSCVI